MDSLLRHSEYKVKYNFTTQKPQRWLNSLPVLGRIRVRTCMAELHTCRTTHFSCMGRVHLLLSRTHLDSDRNMWPELHSTVI